MSDLHILKGTGNNCSCNDCSVLYGGDCYTTPINDFLDSIQEKVRAYIPTMRVREASSADKALNHIKKDLLRELEISSTVYYKRYYVIVQLVYLFTSTFAYVDKYEYRRVRYVLWQIIKEECVATIK